MAGYFSRLRTEVTSTHLLRIARFFCAFCFFALPAARADEDSFRVGFVLPLTGSAAEYGIAIQNSVELATQDDPDRFSRLRFFYEDAAFDPKAAVSAFNTLVDSTHAQLVVTWGVAFCQALAPLAEARKIPLVGICLDPKVAAGKRYFLRFKNTINEVMQVQARHLREQGLRRIAVILAEHPYLEEAADALEHELFPDQTFVIADRIPKTEMDLRTTILRLQKRRADFDALGVFLFAGQISSFYRQARDLHLDIPTFGTDFFESGSEARSAQGAMEGVPFASIEVKPGFVSRYASLFHNESQLAFGAPAYELAMTLGELFNSQGARHSPEEILRAFSTVSERTGNASGPYRYVDSPEYGRYFRFPVVMKKISGDSFSVLPSR